jgi:hypothetical protein
MSRGGAVKALAYLGTAARSTFGPPIASLDMRYADAEALRRGRSTMRRPWGW